MNPPPLSSIDGDLQTDLPYYYFRVPLLGGRELAEFSSLAGDPAPLFIYFPSFVSYYSNGSGRDGSC